MKAILYFYGRLNRLKHAQANDGANECWPMLVQFPKSMQAEAKI